MMPPGYAYIASPELSEIVVKLQAGNQEWNSAAFEWETANPGYRVAVYSGTHCRYGTLHINCLRAVPQGDSSFRRNGRTFQPYKDDRGQRARELMATIPQPTLVNLAAKPWCLRTQHVDLGNGSGVIISPDLERVGDVVFVLSGRVQESEHLTPVKMSDYWAAKESAEANR